MPDVMSHIRKASKIAGCRGIIPLPGSLRGSAPQGFDFAFQRPCEAPTWSEKASFPKPVAGPKILAGAFGGKGGSAPGRCSKAKLRAQKLALHSDGSKILMLQPGPKKSNAHFGASAK
jgi:hypothetical protein